MEYQIIIKFNNGNEECLKDESDEDIKEYTKNASELFLSNKIICIETKITNEKKIIMLRPSDVSSILISTKDNPEMQNIIIDEK